jgi:hypothetical protein
MPDYNNPEIEKLWCDERRVEVIAYLRREDVDHGRVGEWPAWHVAPYVSIWAIESKKRLECVDWWVICGDLPTDYVSAAQIKHPREAVRAIAEKWFRQAQLMARGESSGDIRIGRREDWKALAPLLNSRASMLLEWANDGSIWAGINAR